MNNSTNGYLLHPLDGAVERVARADEHLADLRLLLIEVLRQQADAIIVEFYSDPPHPIRLRPPAETFFKMRIGILVGEICYNLRSALDYLIFALARLDSGIPQDGTQFPIVDTKKDFDQRTKGWLKGVNPTHVAAIEQLQPYMGCNWTKTLRDLSNPDKHRNFVGMGGNFTASGYSRVEDSNFDAIQAPIRRAIHPIHGEVDVKVHFTGKIQFSDGTPVIETLEIVKLQVAETLEAFKLEFK